MTIWKYSAIEIDNNGRRVNGELAGDTAADVRASLRRIGLQVIELRQIRQPLSIRALPGLGAIHERFHAHLRARRQPLRAELYDSLGTLVASGVPLLEAVDTVIRGQRTRRNLMRRMLLDIRESLRSGASLSLAVSSHPSWFDSAEIAMIEAAQHSGQLDDALVHLAARHEHAGELSQKLLGALTYPAVVSVVGLGVVIFLSVRTLPELTSILIENDIPIPPLTNTVMGFGQWLAASWLLLIFLIPLMLVLLSLAPRIAQRLLPPQARERLSERTHNLRYPPIRRRIAIATLCGRLSDLIRTGVPLVDSLRVLAPTVKHAMLRAHLESAAAAIERGDDPAKALDDGFWVDPELVRVLDVGQHAGELDELLTRISHRYERQSRRLIDRLASMLEPAVIIILAAGIGLVVMAAILPLIRLQEVV